MLKPRVVASPLWQYLCPAWDAPSTTLLRTNATQQARRISTNASFKKKKCRRPVWTTTKCYNSSTAIDHLAKRILAPERSWDVSVDSLYTRLNASAIEGDIKDCQQVVEVLLQERYERLNVTMYNALILANVDSVYGGVWRVRNLLEEMEVEKYVPDAATCHNILKVLAVHPDHLLRADVLHRMKDNWFTLSVEGQHDVAAGWLREGCLELAMETLETLQHNGSRVEPWLLDMFVYSLCDAQEIDAAYRIMQARKDLGEPNISSALWQYFLDASSSARHFAGTELAWRAKVKLGQIQVSTGVCENALATACMHGSPALATDIFAHFTKRGDLSTQLHYQLLIDSYLKCQPPDIDRAVRVLSVMALDRLHPTKWQTRSLFMHIRDSAQHTAEALDIIRDLHEKGRDVPISLLNLMIETFIYQGQYASAFEFYKQIPSLLLNTPEKGTPDLETFALLMRACELSEPPNLRQAEDLVSDMSALGKKPTEDINDRLAKIKSAVLALRSENTSSLEKESEYVHATAASA